MTGYRINRAPGESMLNRQKQIRFTFDGRAQTGFAGDTVASALLANGQRLFGRSFKYHRPRGVVSAGSEEANALITLFRDGTTEPNARATMAEIFTGLEAKSQNRWPSLLVDLLSLNQLGGPLLQAGFYYKTFMGPTRNAWRYYEHIIRRAAGLGAAGHAPDTDRYDKINLFTDVLIVGGGLAGITAAEAFAGHDCRVVLVDENAALGGWHRGSSALGRALQQRIDDLAAHTNITILPRTTCFGVYDDGTYGVVERVSHHRAEPDPCAPIERLYKVRTAKAIYACGALERPLVFPGNDRPGVMLADSLRTYAERYDVACGRNVSLFTCHDGTYDSALALAEAGVPVSNIIDSRATVSEELQSKVQAAGITVQPGHAVTGVEGGHGVRQIRIAPFDAASSTVTGNDRPLQCDCLGMSGGWTPTIHLTSQMSGPPVWNDAFSAVLPGESNGRWYACGTMAGFMTNEDVAASAKFAAEDVLLALRILGGIGIRSPLPDIASTQNHQALWRVKGAKGKAFVDFQHDVTASDIQLAHQEGFLSVEHLKRYTTLGMATDQGKLSNINGLALMADARGLPIPEVGTTRFRPPYTPVTIGALAGETRGQRFKPTRRTPMHNWHVQHGASMMDAGLWKRPRIYPKGDETIEQAYIREARAVREGVGMVDVSTLGKIAVQGPDATEFLNRVYSNGFAKLPIGKARYGLMLREDGIVYDDGTTWRLGEHDYLMTTTTAHAAGVMENLEQYLALHWPDLRVAVTSVTDQWAGVAIAGPKARNMLKAVIPNLDWSNKAFPFMAIRHSKSQGHVPVMICRLSFSGELAYEVYCGAGHGAILWEELMVAGEAFDLTPYGMEALGTLRIEKGHVTHAELNGRTTADMVGLGGMVSRKKPSIGSAMVDRPAFVDPERAQMVGLVTDEAEAMRIGAHVVRSPDTANPGLSLGHITSCAYSPALEKYVALALVSAGPSLIGATVYATDPLRGGHVKAVVTDPCFYDRAGERLHV